MIRHDSLTLEELLRIHDEKTGVFIAASLILGAYLGNISDDKIDSLRHFGMLLGRAFQIRDDILDVE
jgi:geranylgeranyl diphosphate synthase, type II